MNQELRSRIERAAKLDAKFRRAAINAGGPYTTRPLIEFGLSIPRTLTVANAAGRARRFLSAAECEEWQQIMLKLIPLLPSDEISATYGLAEMAAF